MDVDYAKHVDKLWIGNPWFRLYWQISTSLRGLTVMMSHWYYLSFYFTFRLIAIGLEQFEAYLKVTSQPPSTSKHKIKGLLIEVMNLVSMYMLPGRDPKQLYFHVRKARLINSNPIQVSVISNISVLNVYWCHRCGVYLMTEYSPFFSVVHNWSFFVCVVSFRTLFCVYSLHLSTYCSVSPVVICSTTLF